MSDANRDNPRREFLRKSLTLIPVVTLASSGLGSSVLQAAPEVTPAAPAATSAKAEAGAYQPSYFTAEEWAFINAAVAQLIPNDGLAFQLGERILGRIKDPVAQAKAIYDWVVDNTIYDPSLPGCGTGNVRRQLINGQYGGRSADINGLFVGICRAVGIPARCVYGLRTGSSRLFRSLGIAGDDATRGQHVRAEFYVPGYSWIPVDPSDVRRAIALDTLSDRDSKLISLRKVLFGVWEMNWIAFNLGTDITLPGRNTAMPFLLHPQMEIGGQVAEDGAQYSIKTRQVVL